MDPMLWMFFWIIVIGLIVGLIWKMFPDDLLPAPFKQAILIVGLIVIVIMVFRFMGGSVPGPHAP